MTHFHFNLNQTKVLVPTCMWNLLVDQQPLKKNFTLNEFGNHRSILCNCRLYLTKNVDRLNTAKRLQMRLDKLISLQSGKEHSAVINLAKAQVLWCSLNNSYIWIWGCWQTGRAKIPGHHLRQNISLQATYRQCSSQGEKRDQRS